jgi:folate-binding protein YgfZ
MSVSAEPGLAEQVAAVRKGVGLWLRDSHTFVRFSGPDAATWLQSQTSNDVLAIQPGQGHANAILDRKAHLVAHFSLHRWEDEFWCLIEKVQVDAFLSSLESHLFVEEVEIDTSGGELEHLVIQGPRAPFFLASQLEGYVSEILELLPAAPYSCHPLELLGHHVLAFRVSVTGEDGYVLVAQSGEGSALLDTLITNGKSFGAHLVASSAQEVLRIEAGLPRFGLDMDASNRIPETTLERDSVSYEKGCYLGQEVVAKLRTYGSVKYALMGLVFEDGGVSPAAGSPVSIAGKESGDIRSSCYSPSLGRNIALAYLDRDVRAPDSVLRFSTGSGEEHSVRVVVLPFVHSQSRDERAHDLFHRALESFERDTHDKDDTAIEMLREAILLSPTFEDAYECLGVILNRHHRVDEAIHYMKILAKLNPDSVMAHTNLSVFYVAKGMIDEAEIEKAEAAVLQLKHARNAKKAEEIAAEERERIRREANERIAMFKEVLEFDPDDPLATFGLGSAYIQLNEYENAIPHLERATKVQKDYSAAYLNLGKCYEFLGRNELAAEAYRKGIEVANRKGDLMPMREMERRLKALPGSA